MAIYETRSPTAERPLDYVELGPGLGPEIDRRLFGTVATKRMLDLGCGGGHTAVGLAQRGARVMAVDASHEQIGAARELAAANDVVVEFHQAELGGLAFLTADQVDIAVSVGALSYVDDLDRVFRQVHRVLKHGGHFVIAVPHPATLCANPIDPHRTDRNWDHPEPVEGRWIHRGEDLVTALVRANFELDALLERHAPDESPHPATLVVRAEKLGT